MKIRPRITVQFEIDGSESDELLAEFKKLESELEDLCAKIIEKYFRSHFKDKIE